jgi:4-hydroxy-tetrahydrodipicolinate synthase
VGVVSVVSNLVPAKVAGLCRAFSEGRQADALKLHRELFDLCRAMFIETNPIPIKAAMKMLGRDTGVLRLPMTDAAPATLTAVHQALTAAGLA